STRHPVPKSGAWLGTRRRHFLAWLTVSADDLYSSAAGHHGCSTAKCPSSPTPVIPTRGQKPSLMTCTHGTSTNLLRRSVPTRPMTSSTAPCMQRFESNFTTVLWRATSPKRSHSQNSIYISRYRPVRRPLRRTFGSSRRRSPYKEERHVRASSPSTSLA